MGVATPNQCHFCLIKLVQFFFPSFFLFLCLIVSKSNPVSSGKVPNCDYHRGNRQWKNNAGSVVTVVVIMW